ncbi:MAG: MopE-related protein, partial [Planctomycetota bacterium]
MRSLIALIGLSLLAAACGGSGPDCAADADCPAGRYCVAGQCTFDCATDADCRVGFRCTIHGRCEPGCVKSNGGLEACDGADNDCDGQTDEDAVPVLTAEAGPLAIDGIDNNCNGLVDEPGGVLIPLPHAPGVWMTAYEIGVYENPDCLGQLFGLVADDYPIGWP